MVRLVGPIQNGIYAVTLYISLGLFTLNDGKHQSKQSQRQTQMLIVYRSQHHRSMCPEQTEGVLGCVHIWYQIKGVHMLDLNGELASL